MVLNEKMAKNLVLNSTGDGYKVKSLGSKNGKFIFHAQNDEVIPSDLIFAVDPNTGKIGTSMMSIKEAIGAIK